MIDNLGGRKFVLAILISIVGGVALWTKVLPVNEWVELMKWVMGTFAVGAGFEYAGKAAEKFADK